MGVNGVGINQAERESPSYVCLIGDTCGLHVFKDFMDDLWQNQDNICNHIESKY